MPSFLAKLDDIQERHDSQFGLVLEGRKPKAPQRLGYAEGVPIGGATATQPGDSWGGGDYSNRQARMDQLLGLYVNCYPLSVAIDVIAKTATAGGLTPRPVRDINSSVGIKQAPPPGVIAVTKLLRYVNPSMDARQLMRGVLTDMYIYGDSFTEVVYLKGAPLALYPLDPSTITVLTDPHGDPTGFHQETKRNKTAEFSLSQVIHVRFDAPGNTIYGLSPIEKLILPVTTWIFGASLLRMTFMKGDPLRAHVDWPIALPDVERQRFQDQYRSRNLGLSNIGTLLETKGGATVQELGTNNIAVWRGNQADVRDEILSGLGVPRSKAGVSQPGGLGGGVGVSEDRNFRINTIGPAQELVLEKFSFKLLYEAYGVQDWALFFGTVDWRDDYILEQIRDLRIRNGTWCVDPGTEILTDSGWKTYDELRLGEMVLTMNHVTGESEWNAVQDIATFDVVDEPMAVIKTRAHSSFSTLNHRWPVLRRTGTGFDRVWTTSEKMTSRDHIVVATPHGSLPAYATYKDSFVELVAWFLTEGTVESETSKFLKIIQYKEDGRNRIRAALEDCFGISYGHTHYRPKNGTAGAWIEKKYGFRVAAPYGKEILDVFEDKKKKIVSIDFILSLTQHQLELFIEACLMGDGVNSKLAGKIGQQTFTQLDRDSADRFQIACILAGKTAPMYSREKSRETSFSDKTQNAVSVNKTTAIRAKDYSYEEVEYTGIVWCPVTENQTWLARRDGKVYFTGNSVNRARADIGEPPVPGGDVALIVDRQNMVVVRDLDALSKANLAVVQLAAAGTDATQKGVGLQTNTTTSKTKNSPTNPPTNPGKPDRMNPAQKQRQATKAKVAPKGGSAPKPPKASESEEFDDDIEESFDDEYVNLTILAPVPYA